MDVVMGIVQHLVGSFDEKAASSALGDTLTTILGSPAADVTRHMLEH